MNIIKFISISSCAVFCTCCCQQEEKRIACIGDSITEGFGIEWQSQNSYPSLLDSILGDGYEVMNFGRSSTTMMQTGNFPYWSAKEFNNVLEYKADVVILKLGTNDAKLFQWDKEKFMTSYQNMIDTLKSINPEITIKICLPAWVAKKRWEITDSVVSNYVIPATKEIAKENSLEIIDIYTLLQNHDEQFLDDGIHPNKAGLLSMAEEIAKHIK